MPHQARVGAVHGDGEDTADLVERGREAMLKKAHEGADGGEPRVAGAGTVAPLVLKMVEEREHEGRVEVLDLEVGGGHAQVAAREREQELEGVGIAGTRMLLGEPLAQKRGDVRRDRGHG